MIAVILAAGVASRLRPLTDETPKCLLKFGNKCFLERTIDALLANHITEFVIVTGYRENQIVEFVKNTFPDLNCHFISNLDYATTNNIYSLWLTKDLVANRQVLLLDSDIIYDPLLVKKLKESPHSSCLAYLRHQLDEEAVKIIIDDQSKIQEISKTCSIDDAAGESIGIELMSKEFIKHLFIELDKMMTIHKQVDVFYEQAFENIIKQGVELFAVDTTELFSMEVDTPEDYKNAINNIPDHLK